MDPVSLDEACSVSSDPRWTPQEKFVWERVCVGDVANFNTAPDYGGELDPTKPASWSQSRILRLAFLRMILFKDAYRRVLTRRGVLIRGGRFTEAIDLENAELEHAVELRDNLLGKGISLRRVRSKFPIGFPRSNVAGAFDSRELQLDADLVMGNGEFADVSLMRAHVSMLELELCLVGHCQRSVDTTLGGDNCTMARRRLSPYRGITLPALTNFARPSLSRASAKPITILTMRLYCASAPNNPLKKSNDPQSPPLPRELLRVGHRGQGHEE